MPLYRRIFRVIMTTFLDLLVILVFRVFWSGASRIFFASSRGAPCQVLSLSFSLSPFLSPLALLSLSLL